MFFRSCAARGRHIVLGGLLLGLGPAISGGVVAQEQPVPPQGAPPEPTFSVAVDLVTTDVIPRNEQGMFLADLTIDDFEVWEDGVRQEIASLVLVHGGRTFSLQDAPVAPVAEGIVLPTARPPSDTAGRIFLIFIDDLHIAYNQTPRIRDLLTQIADTLIHEGDMFGVVSTGPSSIAVDLTYDRKRLDAAIDRVTGAALPTADIVQGADFSQQGPAEVRWRVHTAFKTAYDLLRNMEQVEHRRKALVLLSHGYDFNPFPEGRLVDDPRYGTRLAGIDESLETPDAYTKAGPVFLDSELTLELAEMTDAANRANTTIYAIDPRGLNAGATIEESVSPEEWRTHVSKSQDTLRILAERTGGLAVVNQNRIDDALARIDAETSDYYVLGYYSSNPDTTIKTREIDLRVNREDVDVWWRRSYRLPPTRPESMPR